MNELENMLESGDDIDVNGQNSKLLEVTFQNQKSCQL